LSKRRVAGTSIFAISVIRVVTLKERVRRAMRELAARDDDGPSAA
jgi:hypothetical protein